MFVGSFNSYLQSHGFHIHLAADTGTGGGAIDLVPESHAKKICGVKHDYEFWPNLITDGFIKIIKQNGQRMVEYFRVQHGFSQTALEAIQRYESEKKGRTSEQNVPSNYKSLEMGMHRTGLSEAGLRWCIQEFATPVMTHSQQGLHFSWPHFDAKYKPNHLRAKAMDRQLRSAAVAEEAQAREERTAEQEARANALADARKREDQRCADGRAAVEQRRNQGRN